MVERSDRPDLSDSEWEVMKAVWDRGPMAVGDIYEGLSARQHWAYSTVKTLVRRMVGKGWLDYRRVGNSFLYTAAVERQNAVREAGSKFVRRILDGVLMPFVVRYVEENGLSEEDAAELEQLLERRRKGRRRKGGGSHGRS